MKIWKIFIKFYLFYLLFFNTVSEISKICLIKGTPVKFPDVSKNQVRIPENFQIVSEKWVLEILAKIYLDPRMSIAFLLFFLLGYSFISKILQIFSNLHYHPYWKNTAPSFNIYFLHQFFKCYKMQVPQKWIQLNFTIRTLALNIF